MLIFIPTGIRLHSQSGHVFLPGNTVHVKKVLLQKYCLEKTMYFEIKGKKYTNR